MIRKVVISLFVLAMLIHAVMGIWWLAAAWGVFLLLYLFFTASGKILQWLWSKYLLIIPVLSVIIISFPILFRLFFFEFIGIPSTSMERTILPGDFIYVSKLPYGPRMPVNPYEIIWFNVILLSIEGERADFEREVWQRRRLRGYGSPEINDVVVFAHPYSGDFFIKRCAATPGDTLQLRYGVLYVNGIEIPRPPTINNNPGPATGWDIYRPAAARGWTIDNWGPYVLPSRGMEIELDSVNMVTYGSLVSRLEGVPAGELASMARRGEAYIFKEDYYFFLGDNRHRSHDSRLFGPVPDIDIIGKATRVIFNRNNRIPLSERFMVSLRKERNFRR